jgi:hypothetical protein
MWRRLGQPSSARRPASLIVMRPTSIVVRPGPVTVSRCAVARPASTHGKLPAVCCPVVTRCDAAASRRFLATSHRDPSVCPRSELRSARAAGEARPRETPIGPFRWVDRPLAPSLRYSPVLPDPPLARQAPFCAQNLGPASPEPAAPGGWLNFWRTNILRRRDLAAAASTSDVIQDARPRQRSQMKGIRYGLALIARPQRWR